MAFKSIAMLLECNKMLLRCRAMLRDSDIKFSKIYYSIPNGIASSNVSDLPIHISERDRNETCKKCLRKLM